MPSESKSDHFQIAVNDIDNFNFVVEGAETIARLIGRCTILQNIYLPRTSMASRELEHALVRLYAAIMVYLSKAKGFFEQNSVKRMLKSVMVTSDEFAEYLQTIVTEEQNVERHIALLNAEKCNGISDKLDVLSLKEDKKYAGLEDLLRKLDGLIVRMSSQVNAIEDHLDNSKRIEILRWVSPQPYMEHHKQVSKHTLSGTGRWLLEDSTYAQWLKSSTSSLLWLHGKVGSGKSTLV